MDWRPFLSQPVKPSAQKGLGPQTAQTSLFLRRWGTDPSKTQNRPCWPRVARFWRYNRLCGCIARFRLRAEMSLGQRRDTLRPGGGRLGTAWEKRRCPCDSPGERHCRNLPARSAGANCGKREVHVSSQGKGAMKHTLIPILILCPLAGIRRDPQTPIVPYKKIHIRYFTKL